MRYVFSKYTSAYTFSYLPGTILIHVRQQYGKFFTAISRNNVFFPVQHTSQQYRHLFQAAISLVVSVKVVEKLEMVDIDQYQ